MSESPLAMQNDPQSYSENLDEGSWRIEGSKLEILNCVSVCMLNGNLITTCQPMAMRFLSFLFVHKNVQ